MTVTQPETAAVERAVVEVPTIATPPIVQPRWERRLQQVVLVIARLTLAYLFFANIWWKLPPRFGCANNFAFPTAAADGKLQVNGSTGLCYYIGLESFYAPQPRRILLADLTRIGGPNIGVDISPLAQLNAAFLNGVVIPNIGVFGYLIFAAEAFIAISLLLGLFTRLGGLVAIGISAQLLIGLANIPSPFEWEWSYNQMVLLSLLMVGLAPGRVFGLDALLRPRLLAAAANGNPVARIGLLLT